MALTSGAFTALLLGSSQKLFRGFSKQNLLCFALPILAWLTYLAVVFGMDISALLYAAVPTLLVALSFSKNTIQPAKAA